MKIKKCEVCLYNRRGQCFHTFEFGGHGERAKSFRSTIKKGDTECLGYVFKYEENLILPKGGIIADNH